jgi:HK97 family phage major capsid protein
MTDQPIAGDDPIVEARTALDGFIEEFRGFRGRLETRLRAQDDRIATLDRKAAARPALSAAAERETPHRKAIGAYLRTGDESGLRGLALDGKGMTTLVGGDGGFLVDAQTAHQIAAVRAGGDAIRGVATVVAVEAGTYEVLVDHDDLATAWATETGVMAETAAPTLTRIVIPLHEIAAMPRASQRLLEDSAFDVECWLAGCIADRFARAENAAFVTGDGVNKPKGFLAHPTAPAAAAAWGAIGYVASGGAGAFGGSDPSDAIVDLVYSLPAQYRANAVFVMNSKTASVIRKMKDAEGRFFWAESLSLEQPARLLGHRVVISEEMPDIAPGAFAVAFGDFRVGYTIVERPELRILRDPYSVKPHVQFYASQRVGGDVTDFSAIRLLKFAAS